MHDSNEAVKYIMLRCISIKARGRLARAHLPNIFLPFPESFQRTILYLRQPRTSTKQSYLSPWASLHRNFFVIERSLTMPGLRRLRRGSSLFFLLNIPALSLRTDGREPRAMNHRSVIPRPREHAIYISDLSSLLSLPFPPLTLSLSSLFRPKRLESSLRLLWLHGQIRRFIDRHCERIFVGDLREVDRFSALRAFARPSARSRGVALIAPIHHNRARGVSPRAASIRRENKYDRAGCTEGKRAGGQANVGRRKGEEKKILRERERERRGNLDEGATEMHKCSTRHIHVPRIPIACPVEGRAGDALSLSLSR